MEKNKKSIDSLCTFLEQLKVQHTATKKNLRRYVDSELDRTFNAMVTGLMVWASKNLPCSSSSFTKMLSVVESNEVNEASPNLEDELNAHHQSANFPSMETEVNSQEIIQLSDESILSKMSSDDDENGEHCECTECNHQLPANVEIKQEKSQEEVEADLCDNLNSQFSNVTHISDSQPQLDDDVPYDVSSDFDFEEETSASQNHTEATVSTEHRQEEDFENASSPAQTADLLVHKQSSKKTRFLSLKCQHKAACKGSPSCEENFPSRVALQVHMERVHQVLPFECHQYRCSESFNTQNELNSHLKRMHSKLTHYQCSDCLKMFREHNCLVRHWRYFHQQGVVACAFRKCKWRGTVHSQAKKHFQLAHVPPLTCSYPGCPRMYFAYNDRSSLLRHIRKEHSNLTDQTQEKPGDSQNPKQVKPNPVSEEANAKTNNTNTSTSTLESLAENRRNRVYQCKWSGCTYSSKSRLDIHVHVNEMHSRHKTVMVKHSEVS